MTAAAPLIRALAAALALAAAALAATPAAAVLRLDVTEGTVQPMPIAVPGFVPGTGQDGELSASVAGVIEADLKRSGLFAPIDHGAFIEKVSNIDVPPRFGDWRIVNAQALVTGRVTRQPDGRIKTEFRLWDIFSGQQMLGQQYVTQSENWRRVAHIIADAIYERITGEKGYFDTRVVFIDETGPKNKRVKRLAIMDQDGANVRFLSRGDDLVLTPRYSPTSQDITYMSFAGGQPRVYLLNIETGQREIVGNFPNMTFSPRFSPDGQRVVLSLEQGGNANIFMMDLRSRATTRLTNAPAIDTAPSFSPDGRQIVFESDRGGTQQLYVMNADGSGANRISFGEGRYGQPVWSPRGDLIVFTKQVSGKFAIGVMKPDGSGERIIVESGDVIESATWAPNGRVIMYAKNAGGPGGGPQLWSVDITGYNDQRVPTPSFASDPAWSPLLK